MGDGKKRERETKKSGRGIRWATTEVEADSPAKCIQRESTQKNQDGPAATTRRAWRPREGFVVWARAASPGPDAVPCCNPLWSWCGGGLDGAVEPPAQWDEMDAARSPKPGDERMTR